MKDLHNWFVNPFDDDKISMREIVTFTTDHVQRMASNPLPQLNGRVLATNNALTLVTTAFDDDDVKLALRKAQKLAKNNYRKALLPQIGKVALAVQFLFGETSPEFVTCFPHGRTIFNTAPDDQLGSYLQTTLTGVGSLTPPLDPQVQMDTQSIKDGWLAVYVPSETSTGAKTTTVEAKHTARLALQLELFKNLVLLAQAFPRQPDRLDLYMQPSLLLPLTQSPATPAPAPTPTPPGP